MTYVWLTAREVAAELKLGHSTVCEKAARGALPATRIDGVWRFRRDLLDAYLVNRTSLGKAVADRQPVQARTLVPPLTGEVIPICGPDVPWRKSR